MIAVVVGHREHAQGAVAITGATEWEWNRALAERVAIELTALHVEARVVYRPDTRDGYARQAQLLNLLGPRAIVELHFNGGPPAVTGTETLAHPRSPRGLHLAALIQSAMVAVLELPDRGLKATTSNGAGNELLTLTRTLAPACIVESHFGSNSDDHRIATERREELAAAIAEAIYAWLEVPQ